MGQELRTLAFLVALTPLHAGVGRAEGAHVDLPVQRDEFDLPAVWASSLKGALRSRAALKIFGGNEPSSIRDCRKDRERDKEGERKGEERRNEWVERCEAFFVCFGPAAGGAEVSEYASALSFLDARLLLIPARSLRGMWLYVTTPHMLRLYSVYREAVGFGLDRDVDGLAGKVREGALASSAEFLVDGKLVVNEQLLPAEVDERLLERLGLPDALWAELRKFRDPPAVAVVPDRYGHEVVRRSLLVQYRVRLRRDTKTVAEGALWSEEYVPQFSVFVTGVVAGRPRRLGGGVRQQPSQQEGAPSAVRSREKVESGGCLEFLRGEVGDVFELGGKETVGKGLVRVVWHLGGGQ